MTKKQQKQEWEELFEYVKLEVMGYADKIMPKEFILRLKGLSEGKFMANKNIKSQAKYSYKEILLTFKLCKAKINDYFMRNNGQFESDQHKFYGAMRIVESEINNTIAMLNRRKIAEEKIETTNYDNIVSDRADYTNKSTGVNKRLKGLL